jgi:hypothetical protein
MMELRLGLYIVGTAIQNAKERLEEDKNIWGRTIRPHIFYKHIEKFKIYIV